MNDASYGPMTGMPTAPDEVEEAENCVSRTAYLYRDDTLQAAAQQLEILLKKWPRYTPALYRVGEIRVKLKQFREAAEAFWRVAEIEPNRADAHLSLGKAYLQYGQIRQGNAALVMAILLDADLAFSRCADAILLALTYAQVNDINWLQELTVAFQKAILKAPDSAQIHHCFGRVLAEGSQHQQATTEFENALRLRPDFPECLVSLGYSYLHLNQPQRAVACFQGTAGKTWKRRAERMRLSEASSSREILPAHALIAQATAYLHTGDYDLADSTARTAAEIAAESITDENERAAEEETAWQEYRDACEELGSTLLQAREFGAAMEVYRRKVEYWQRFGFREYEVDECVQDFYHCGLCVYACGIRLSQDKQRRSLLTSADSYITEALALIEEQGGSSSSQSIIRRLHSDIATALGETY